MSAVSNTVRAPAIEASGLTKTYKTGDTAVEAVKGIDLRVEAGQTYGFLGPNGAGKSTTIEMLCTIRNPSGGVARVAGFDVVRQRDQVRRRIGLVFQQQTLDLQLTADPAFRGDASKHNPEDLLLAAISSCHMLSYLALCAKYGINVLSYEDRATGIMREDGKGGAVVRKDATYRLYWERVK